MQKTIPNINSTVTVGATPVPVPTVITLTTAPIIEFQAPVIMTPQATLERIITIKQGMSRGTFNILTPPGQNTPNTTPQAPQVATANQAKGYLLPE